MQEQIHIWKQIDACNLIPTENMFLANIPGHNFKTAKSAKETQPVL